MPPPPEPIQFVDPDNQGNAWMAIRTADGVIRYMSDQWNGRVFGFERRDRITLAQSPSPAVGIVAFGGGGIGIARPLPEEYRYHIVDETLKAPRDGRAASAQAAGFLAAEDARRAALYTVLALTHPVPSTVEADALSGSPARKALRRALRQARDALRGWDKDLFIDRIALSLLEGAPATSETAALFHYAAVARDLRIEVAQTAGQVPLPLVVVSQSAGLLADGTSEVILAEGRLDWAHWGLGFVVATPRYPFAHDPDMPGTMTPQSALAVSELESVAVAERLAGRDWFCPSLERAVLDGATIRARFATMTPLRLRDAENHGFAVDGIQNGAAITGVSVQGDMALIALDRPPRGVLALRYAWGETGDRGDGLPANRGSLTDGWEQDSRLQPGLRLMRHARSGRVPVTAPATLPEATPPEDSPK